MLDQRRHDLSEPWRCVGTHRPYDLLGKLAAQWGGLDFGTHDVDGAVVALLKSISTKAGVTCVKDERLSMTA